MTRMCDSILIIEEHTIKCQKWNDCQKRICQSDMTPIQWIFDQIIFVRLTRLYFIMICMKCSEIHSRKVKIIKIITHLFCFIANFAKEKRRNMFHMKIGDAHKIGNLSAVRKI